MKVSIVNSELKKYLRIVFVLIFLVSTFAVSTPEAAQAAAAGFSEYYIPGSTDQLFQILKDIDNDPDLGNALGGGGTCTTAPCNRMHNVITVSISADNVTVYYDHWENGYGTGSTGIDETYLVNKGDVLTFESANILVPRNAGDTCTSTNANGAATACYDGRDRIYVAGGVVSVAEAFWPEVTQTVFANAWEVYPVKPYQTDYTIPVGEDLSGGPLNYIDFTQAFVIVQATQDATNVQIDNPATAGVEVNVTLNRGETTQMFHIDAGTTVHATAPVQTQFIVGRPSAGLDSDSRSYTAVPSGLWSTSYYGSVPSFFNGFSNTDVFIYNPTSSNLSINYEDSTGSGSFVVPPNSTRGYQTLSGHYVPENSAVFLEAADGATNFWAIGSVNSGNGAFNYGFSFIPADQLTNDYYLGWAPGTTDLSANGSPVFVTPVVDNTTIFVDYSPNDGIVDATYTLDRIQIQRIFDPDNNNTGMHIWATNPIVVVWGEDGTAAQPGNPYIDAGYTVLPLNEQWVDVVLTLEKTADPTIIPSEIGAITTFTLVTRTDTFGLQDVSVEDNLPAEWGYVAGSTIITLPDGTTITGTSADPDIAGQQLTWDDFPVGPLDMNGNETLTIQFQAETVTIPTQDVYLNEATSMGTNGTETFSATDNAAVAVYSLAIEKVSSAGGTVNVGDPITYIINITNNGGTAHNNVVVTDPLPVGTTYVLESTSVSGFVSESVGDAFNAIAFTGNQDSNVSDPSWAGNWIEVNEADGAGAGDIQVLNDISNYQLRIQNNGGGSGEGVFRDVELSACTNATLRLDYRRNALDDPNDFVRLSIGVSGTITDTIIDFAGPAIDPAYQSYSVDITPWISTQTRIQLLSSPAFGSADQVFFDNVLITCFVPTVKDNIPAGSNADLTSGTPSTLVTSADGFDLAPDATMTVTFQVTVDNPVPGGQTDVVNTVTVTSDEQVDPLQDTVTDVLPPPGAISGSVFADTNNDDIGDAPIAGVTIELLDEFGNVVATTTTLPDGSYSFPNVPPGTYFVRETQPAGYDSVNDIDGGDPDLIGDVTPIVVNPGETNAGNDFVEEQPGAITGTVLADTDNDDIGDTPIGGVTLELLDEFGNPVDSDPNTPGVQPTTTTTNPDGTYSFTNVPPGNYQVQETQPAGYNSVSDIDGGDLDVIGDQALITVTAGATNSGNDFVEEQLGSISGQVRYDSDNDGNPADPDNPITGVTVELYDENGVLIATTTTDGLGNYTFADLPPGNYVVVEINPPGYTSTYDLDGSATNTLDQISVTLGAGQNSTGNDFLDTSIPHIDVEKNPPTQTVASGTNVNFTITVTNDGAVDLDPVVVTDVLCDTLTLTDDGDGNTTLEVDETWTYTCIVNNVIADFTNTVNAVGTPPLGPNVNDSDTAEVDVLPEITVTKDASVTSVPETGGSVTFTYTVTNTGTVDVAITSLADDQFGVLAGDADCQVGTPLAPNESCNFDFITTLSGTVGVSHVNVFTANAEDDAGNPASDEDNATVDFTPVPSGLDKSLTDSNSTYTTGPQVAIGELLTYQVSVDIPPGDFANARVVDTMDRGLAFVECVSINAPGLTTDVVGSFTEICSPSPPPSPTTDDAGGGTPMDVDRRVTFGFGTLSNNGQTDATLTVTYRVIVLDIAANVDGVTLNNTALFSWTGGSIGPAQTEVTLVEPDIEIEKTSNVNTIDVGSEVTFTLTISHTNTSTADAHDMVVVDILPTGLDYVANSIDCTAGAQDPDVECVFDNSNSSQPTIRAEWSVFALNNGNGQITFRVAGNSSLPASGSITNVASVEWTSMPGDQLVPDTFSDPANQYATERYYDPNDPNLINTTYTANDALALTRPGGGGGGGGNNPPPSPSSIGGFLIPVTGFAPGMVTNMTNVPHAVYNDTSITLDIPSLSVEIPVVGVPKKEGTWNVSWLGNQAGWLEGSAFPSWNGNSVLTSHVYLPNGKPGPFAKLHELKTGDQVIVHAYGQQYIFEVLTNAIISPTDKSVMRHEERPWLTLVTCTDYDVKTGTYKNRFIVRAVLVKVTTDK